MKRNTLPILIFLTVAGLMLITVHVQGRHRTDYRRASELLADAAYIMHRLPGLDAAPRGLPADYAPPFGLTRLDFTDPTTLEQLRRQTVKELEQAVDLAPILEDARFDLALLYLDIDRPDLAAKQLHKLLRAAPNDAPARQLRAHAVAEANAMALRQKHAMK